jgi:hypothetical protein
MIHLYPKFLGVIPGVIKISLKMTPRKRRNFLIVNLFIA